MYGLVILLKNESDYRKGYDKQAKVDCTPVIAPGIFRYILFPKIGSDTA
jgi:hypothetical protein